MVKDGVLHPQSQVAQPQYDFFSLVVPCVCVHVLVCRRVCRRTLVTFAGRARSGRLIHGYITHAISGVPNGIKNQK